MNFAPNIERVSAEKQQQNALVSAVGIYESRPKHLANLESVAKGNSCSSCSVSGVPALRVQVEADGVAPVESAWRTTNSP